MLHIYRRQNCIYYDWQMLSMSVLSNPLLKNGNLHEGRPITVHVDGKAVLLVLASEKIYALDAVCLYVCMFVYAYVYACTTLVICLPKLLFSG